MRIYAIQLAFTRREIRGQPDHAPFPQLSFHTSINPTTIKEHHEIFKNFSSRPQHRRCKRLNRSRHGRHEGYGETQCPGERHSHQ